MAKPMANEPGVTTVVSKYALSCSTGISASTLPEPEIVLPCTVTVGALFLDESPITGSKAGPTSVGSPEEKQQPILRPLRLCARWRPPAVVEPTIDKLPAQHASCVCGSQMGERNSDA